MMTTRGAKLQTRRGKTKQFKQHDCLSSAGKKRAALGDVTNHLTVKHPAYHKKVELYHIMIHLTAILYYDQEFDDELDNMHPVSTDRIDEPGNYGNPSYCY